MNYESLLPWNIETFLLSKFKKEIDKILSQILSLSSYLCYYCDNSVKK